MTQRFAELMFTPAVKSVQERMGSRGAYERFEEPDAPANDRLGKTEREFIAERDSFYVATVSETGWPYVQHRGGARGFLKVLDDRTLGFVDFRGNRQYVSVGNLLHDDRVSLFLMDYPGRRRLKILGHARIVDVRSDPQTLERLRDENYEASIERAMVIELEGFDWNCPQHITPRFTESQIEELAQPLRNRLRDAEAERDLLRNHGAVPDSIGSGPLELSICGVRQLTPRVRLYDLRRPDGGDLPAVEAGAHLPVPVRLHDGTQTLRTYSICSDPHHRDVYEIAVLRDEKGRGGSVSVHSHYALGTTLRCGLPQNAFPLHGDARPAVLIAGGIGITPLRAMARVLSREGRLARLFYAARSAREAAFAPELARLYEGRVEFRFDADHLDIEEALDAAGTDAIVYVCGPEGLIQAVARQAANRGWPDGRVRFERFAAATASANRPFTIVLAKSGNRVAVTPGESALDALDRSGAPVPSSCRTGTCGTCIVRLAGGEAEHRDSVLTEAQRAAGLFTPCVSRARTPELVLDV